MSLFFSERGGGRHDIHTPISSGRPKENRCEIVPIIILEDWTLTLSHSGESWWNFVKIAKPRTVTWCSKAAFSDTFEMSLVRRNRINTGCGATSSPVTSQLPLSQVSDFHAFKGYWAVIKINLSSVLVISYVGYKIMLEEPVQVVCGPPLAPQKIGQSAPCFPWLSCYRLAMAHPADSWTYRA